MNKNKFIKNAFLLVLVNLFIRLVWTWFRVVISNKVGAECMGLYQLTFSVYNISVNLACSGINFAATRLVSKSITKSGEERAKDIAKKCIAYAIFFGVCSSVLVYIFSDLIAEKILFDVRTEISLKAFSVSLPFISISSALSGYFYAKRDVSVTLVARILEQFSQILIFCLLFCAFGGADVEISCFIIVVSMTFSEAIGGVWLFVCFLSQNRKIVAKKYPKAIRKICKVALSSALGTYIKSGLQTAENIMIPIGLRKYGASNTDALAGYGILCSMVMPVIFFPSFVLSAFSMLLIPEFTEEQALNNKQNIQKMTSLSIKFTLLFALLVSANLICFGRDIGILLYSEKRAGILVQMLAPLIPFMYLDSVADGMLKGLGEYNRVLAYSSVDTIVSIAMIYFFLPKFGLYGYVLVIYVSSALNAFLSIGRLLEITQSKIEFFSDLLIPFSAALFSSFSAKALLAFANISSTLVSVTLSVVLFGLFVVISKGKMYFTVRTTVSLLFPHTIDGHFRLNKCINNK